MLTERQSKFVASYQLTGNTTEAAKNAGYSVKTADVIGCRLIKNPKIVNQLEQWKAKKSSEISKADFIDIAMGKFNGLESTEPNSPRFLDLAGKALGHIGSTNDRPSSTINNVTQININAINTQADAWALTRKLLESQGL